MPVPATCGHCARVINLPDGWAQPGFTCPFCHRPTALPLPLAPAPRMILPPPPPPAEQRVIETHTYDRTPRRSAVGTAFGSVIGCFLGVVFIIFLVVGGCCAGFNYLEAMKGQ